MASCLGLYIENNLIKYAKVSKNNEAIKVESFGIKFYENLQETINQIIEETYSFKSLISINASEEIYNKIEVFSMLNRKDIEGVIKTEFEDICSQRDINQNIYEQRYIFTGTKENERLKVIHIAMPKTTIAQRKNQMNKINSILPVSVTIPNLVKKEKKTTAIIVNMESDTTITKFSEKGILDISVLKIGAKNVLDSINKKENSYSKSYEICKNSTIYTENDKDLQYEENDYLDDIMPTCYQLATEVRRMVDESLEKIDKVYLTGTLAVINNIDIYFQDALKNVPCEIVRPSFININSKINIKDYIEVNSAISIALQGLDKKNTEINFTKESSLDKLKMILTIDVSKKNTQDVSKAVDDFLSKFGRQYNTAFLTFGILTAVYLIGGFVINNQFNKKIQRTDIAISNTNSRIEKIKEYNKQFNTQITDYQTLINNIQNMNDANSEDKRYKNTIPNLLNNIMAIIPKNVQLTSIENTSNSHIVIVAKTTKYEQAAFFKAKLKTEKILKDVVSDSGTIQSGYLTVTIEGELP